MKSKITWFGSRFTEKSKKKKLYRKLITKREKSEIKYKINLIYDSKLQSNDTGQKIRRKTHNLTPESARHDPIDHRIIGFSFHDFKDDRWHSRGEFSLFFRQNLTFNHSLNAKMSLEEEESERFDDWDF